ncbi:hypothetical protein [Stenotrophomonas indicatrix]|jgi:hypothetical protein|uniref:hypothetical protein n=1 Tax=Stenotrophomonas indicatrix TaxID=2045451 RepID=UPI00242AB92D|nr:hypothetical protein [Stenotrophomonas indicatrix]
MNDSRRISMLELDRHLSQSLEQARHAPVNVQRYGQPWVWMLSSDAWADAARWSALDVSGHPLMLLRQALDACLQPWPEAALATLAQESAEVRMVQRAVLLIALCAPGSVQRLHDDLRYHQVYRQFIGFDHGMAWSPLQCMRLLQACAAPLLQHCVEETLARVPSSLLDAACVGNARGVGDRLQERPISAGCLSY